MEDKDLKYNQMMDQLRKTEITLNDAEGLTDSIMHKVEQMTAGAGRTRMMRILGSISGVAASALICLLAYETLKYPPVPVENHFNTVWVVVEKEYPRKITEHSVQEKKEIIETVIKIKEARLVRKEQWLASLIAAKR